MKTADQMKAEIDDQRDRLSKFVETGVRINEILEFEAVLQSVLDSAHALVHDRYGVIALQDDEGVAEDFLSSGLTADEACFLCAFPEPEKVFEVMNSYAGPRDSGVCLPTSTRWASTVH